MELYEKKYKEALERMESWARGEHPECFTEAQKAAEFIFPELKESEDEKIRKELIKFVKVNIPDEERYIAWLEKQGEHLENYDEAEKEKSDFVGDGFIECHADFLDFKEGNTYWLEYIGDDKYNVRSDNLLGKTYHITPCQLYTVFKKLTWLEKQCEQKSTVDTNFKIEKGKWYVCTQTFILRGKEVIIKGQTYQAEKDNVIKGEDGRRFIEKHEASDYLRAWTIKNAKDGDVLFHSDSASNGIFIFKELLKYEFNEKVICYCDYDSEDHFCLGESHTCCWADAKILHPATKEQRDLLFRKMHEAGYEWDFEKKELKKIEQNLADKPKFKVKYAGSEYNVFKTKDIAGVTFYGIEDEPNHIDYVKADNCEIISGYGIKESGLSIPTKPVMFSEQNPALSEEDEIMIKVLDSIIRYIVEIVDKDALERFGTNREELFSWLKSLRPRWKPSDEQIKALEAMLTVSPQSPAITSALLVLYEQLKKLTE